jgi:hypothetical protein
MRKTMGWLVILSGAIALLTVSGAPVKPAYGCVIANYKNAANQCPRGTEFGHYKPAPPLAGPLGCVKTNVKNFRNACAV